jgi:nucleoside-diphosphate-sugar epimerase
MDKKKVLVTGATGFLGRNVFEFLSKRDDLDVYGTYFNSPDFSDKNNYEHVDLRDREQTEWALNGMDVVAHFASVTGGMGDAQERMNTYITENMTINTNLFNALYTCGVPQAILPSCSIMYPSSGSPQREEDFNSETEIEGQDLIFAQVKLSLEGFAEGYAREGRTKFVVMRHSNMYGPHDHFDEKRSHMFGANLGRIVRAKDDDTITVWGDGKAERDLLYVDDLSRFVDMALLPTVDSFNLLNVGCGGSIPVKDLIQKMVSISGKDLEIEFDKSKPTKNDKIALDSSKAREIYGWSPEISLEEGIRKTMDWYGDSIK